jgi:hypothetical protein
VSPLPCGESVREDSKGDTYAKLRRLIESSTGRERGKGTSGRGCHISKGAEAWQVWGNANNAVWLERSISGGWVTEMRLGGRKVGC